MFLYNSRLLKAEVSNGILETQTLMINLYTSNLNSVGYQAALIATVTYFGVNTCYIQDDSIRANGYLPVMYQACYAASLSSALIMVSHCILASMLGPTKSLTGETSDAVQICVRDMYREQELGVCLLFTSIGFIFVGTSLQMWDNYPFYIAITLSTIYFFAFIIFSWTGWHTLRVFQLDYNISKYHLQKDRDLEADIGFTDDDIDCISYHKAGYTILDHDIMALQEQITPGAILARPGSSAVPSSPTKVAKEESNYLDNSVHVKPTIKASNHLDDDDIITVNEKTYLKYSLKPKQAIVSRNV